MSCELAALPFQAHANYETYYIISLIIIIFDNLIDTGTYTISHHNIHKIRLE